MLPLRARPVPRRSGRVLAIGARGGLIKASTGYGYQRIQRDSKAIAVSLARHGHPFDIAPPPRRHRLLDAVLLDVLDRDPAQLERAFARLFVANPTARVLRFLDEDSRVRDELRLASSDALPPRDRRTRHPSTYLKQRHTSAHSPVPAYGHQAWRARDFWPLRAVLTAPTLHL